MDCQLPPSVTYWTGTWDPQREAISQEIAALRTLGHPAAPVVAFSPGNRTAWPTDGVWRLSGRRWITFRTLAALIEPGGDVTHAFGPLNGWHLLRSLGRRPFVFTVVIPAEPLEQRSLYDRVTVFVAESESLAGSLRRMGVRDERIQVIYPGVDLQRFRHRPLPGGRFRMLFASSPADPAELDARGVPQLIELARRHPDVDVVVLWRNWGKAAEGKRLLATFDPPPNFIVEQRGARDMAELFASAHATVCLFQEGFGKSCPNSVVEGLACGRPALVSDSCGIADLLIEHGAGVAAARTPDALSAGLERLRRDFLRRTAEARQLAERCFSRPRFLKQYRDLYAALAAGAELPARVGEAHAASR